MNWEVVIGLEIHVQLNTKSKLFSGASTQFGAIPNTQACAIDLAMPGTLPVVNQQAINHALLFGLAIDAHIPEVSVFERKNYFYPDLPKGYQTTQLDKPIIGKGAIDIELSDGSKKLIRIHHAHLEEDAGKSLHKGSFDKHCSGIDLNRAGTALIEIVTEPDISNSSEAVLFAKKLHGLVTSIGICDGHMAEGSMRFDVNVSIRPLGEKTLGTRTETKNLNSFKFMEEAITLEVDRQIGILEGGGSVVQETRLYNGENKRARAMRSKEEANDYRYFPCPDLLPIVVTKKQLQSLRQTLPELPDERSRRLIETYMIAPADAKTLANQKALSDYFEQVAVKSGQPKLAANWVTGELLARLNNEGRDLGDCPVPPDQLSLLVTHLHDDKISGKMAKEIFDAIWHGEGEVDEVIKGRGLKQISDSAALERVVTGVLNSNQSLVKEYILADEKRRKKKLGAFMGQIMSVSKGQANPSQASQILVRTLQEIIDSS